MHYRCTWCGQLVLSPWQYHEGAEVCIEQQKMIDKAKLKSAHQQNVEDFMNRMRSLSGNLPQLPSVPTIPDKAMILAQAKLILEETLEVLDAVGINVYINYEGIAGMAEQEPLVKRDFRLGCNDAKIDLVHVAKELADLSVVNTGMSAEFGIALNAVLEEVDINNLLKFENGGFLDSERKLRKAANHPKPDIKSILLMQGMVEDNEVIHEESKANENLVL